MRRKNTTITILFILGINLLIITPLSVHAVDPTALSATATETNVKLQTKFFKDRVDGNGFLGVGLDGSSRIDGDGEIYTAPNTIGYGALYTRYIRSGNAETKSWADVDVYPLVSNLIAGKLDAFRNTVDTLYYTIDQGIGLEFMSLGYEHSKDQEMLQILQNVYNEMVTFQASDSEDKGHDGAYWVAIDEDKVKETGAGYDYCNANASLWAIIGMLKFGQTVKGLTDDLTHNFSATSVARAEETIQFVESKCFYNGSGFREYPYAELIEPDDRFYFNTQVLGLLAYTRLYQATLEQHYLDKANMMIEYIITKNFLRTGTIGGCVDYYAAGDPDDVSVTKLGYDNALYAYALINLYVVQGEVDVAPLRRAEEIVDFMNRKLLTQTTDGELVGYAEYLVNDTLAAAPFDDYRFFVTNALMLLVNEEIIFYERPWFIKYLWFLVIGAIVIVVVIGVSVGVKRRKDVGRKLPKLVKGLVE